VKRLEQILVRVLEISFSICFLVMFALVVTQVILRYVFNESIGGANELATILFAYTSALGIAVGIAKRDHMAISWFTERFPARLRKAVDVLGLALLLLLNLVIFWYSLRWIDITGSRMISASTCRVGQPRSRSRSVPESRQSSASSSSGWGSRVMKSSDFPGCRMTDRW
jgi:TRAP-type C4-dicarboxylate transport system permease small subunit